MTMQINQTRARESGSGSTFLTARIGGVLHAIPIGFVEEILPCLPVERIAQLPSFVRGVVSIRGHLIPVLDAADRLGLLRPAGQEPHLVCLSLQNRLIGLEVDEAIDLVELPDSPRISVPDLGGTSYFLSAVMDHQGEMIRILNPEKLLLQEEPAQLDGEVSEIILPQSSTVTDNLMVAPD